MQAFVMLCLVVGAYSLPAIHTDTDLQPANEQQANQIDGRGKIK
jgi:hypothetical protein